ncbi:MAG: ABC transporter permease [Rhodothermales bacterium]
MTRRTHPPDSAIRFLDWYCRGDVYEEIRGDLDESFVQNIQRMGVFRARCIYWKEVLLFMRAHSLRARRRQPMERTAMILNHLVTSGRSIRREKGISALNLSGLAVGMAVALLLALYVQDELAYDQYHEDSHRIFRVNGEYDADGFHGIAKINGPWGIRGAQEVPAVEAVARFSPFGSTFAEVDGERLPIVGTLFADSTVFDVFTWPFLAGDERTALRAPGSVVLTRSLAEQLFGGPDVMGREVVLGGGDLYRVTGVMEDVPRTSHFRFPMLVSMASYTDERHDDWWRWNQYYTYVKLAPGADPAVTGAAMSDVVAANIPAEATIDGAGVWLQPLTDIWLRSNQFREMYPTGDAKRVWTLGLLGLLVLVVAALNFVNLVTARASQRSHEVGVRKSLGADSWGVISRFLTESMVLAVLGGMLAIGLALAVVPEFNALTGKAFMWQDFLGGQALGWLALFILGIGLVAGWYPALVQSRFTPGVAMRGDGPKGGSRGGSNRLRHILVVFQFAVSAALLMLAGIVDDQMQYVEEVPLGFEQDNRVAIPLQDASMQSRLEDIRRAILDVPGVSGVTMSGNRPGGSDWGIPAEVPGVPAEQMPSIRMLVGDWDFPVVYGLELREGRFFDRAFGTDRASAVLVNEEFVRQMDWDEPIGKAVLMPAVGRSLEVVGVVKDFHFRSLHERISPVMLFMAPDAWYSQMTVALTGNASQGTIDALAEVYVRFDPVNPFRSVFLDEQFDALYVAERRAATLVTYGTWLALLVACLGLIGLALFAAQRRRREIGIRKVVGASEWNLVMLLSRSMAGLVLLALGLALPVAWWLGARWLDGFAYATHVQPTTLMAGGLLVFGLAIGTTAVLSWRASRMDPVVTLRTE